MRTRLGAGRSQLRCQIRDDPPSTRLGHPSSPLCHPLTDPMISSTRCEPRAAAGPGHHRRELTHIAMRRPRCVQVFAVGTSSSFLVLLVFWCSCGRQRAVRRLMAEGCLQAPIQDLVARLSPAVGLSSPSMSGTAMCPGVLIVGRSGATDRTEHLRGFVPSCGKLTTWRAGGWWSSAESLCGLATRLEPWKLRCATD